MNWKIKHALRQSILHLPGGAQLYRKLTSEVLGTQAGMAAKWFRVMPAHIKVLQEHYGENARAQRMWCFDSGATIAAGLAMAIVSDEIGVLTDRRDRLSSRYNDASRRILHDKGTSLAELSNAPTDRVEEIMRACNIKDACDILSALKIAYSPSHAVVNEDKWTGTVGYVFSAGTLEHYTPDELEAVITLQSQSLKSGGVLSHVVDHRDHRWHADKTLCPLEHLTIPDDAYSSRFSNALDYHNRWLRSQWVALLERHDFRVACRTINTYTNDMPALDKSRLVKNFQNASDEDLNSLVTHFVAVKS